MPTRWRELLGCYPVLVPPNPGVLSALGFLEADFRNEFVQTFIRSTKALDPERGLVALRRARGKGHRPGSTSRTLRPKDASIEYALDLRYEQQGFEVAVPVSAEDVRKKGGIDKALDDFHALHERTYGVRFHVPVELVALRVVARGATPSGRRGRAGRRSAGTSRRRSSRPARPISTAPGTDTPHYDRDKLGVGAAVDGPAIIRQYDTTTVLLPGHYAEIDTQRQHPDLAGLEGKGN